MEFEIKAAYVIYVPYIKIVKSTKNEENIAWYACCKRL